MLKFIHRVNTIDFLQKVPKDFGVEIDVRGYKNTLILNHEPLRKGELLEKFLSHFKHKGIIFNIKEAGIEEKVLEFAHTFEIKTYFLLDVEFPYIYRAARQNMRNIAIRYSEDEPIQAALNYKNLVDWVWIDTNTKLPLTLSTIKKLHSFKTCLVSPDRWGRPEDIPKYKTKMKKLNFSLDAVMTDIKYVDLW